MWETVICCFYFWNKKSDLADDNNLNIMHVPIFTIPNSLSV